MGVFSLQSDSQVYGDAKTLEEFFEHLLLKWLPNFNFPKGTCESDEESMQDEQGNDNGDIAPPAKRIKRGIVEWCHASGNVLAESVNTFPAGDNYYVKIATVVTFFQEGMEKEIIWTVTCHMPNVHKCELCLGN